jgi:hypothetical protein
MIDVQARWLSECRLQTESFGSRLFMKRSDKVPILRGFMMLDKAYLKLNFFMVKCFYLSQPNPLILVVLDLCRANPY